MRISEQTVRERAYYIWEGEGRIHGRAAEHWIRAEIELGAVSAAPAEKAVEAAAPKVTKTGAKAAPVAAARPAAQKAVKAPAKTGAKNTAKAAVVAGLAAKAKPARAPAALH